MDKRLRCGVFAKKKLTASLFRQSISTRMAKAALFRRSNSELLTPTREDDRGVGDFSPLFENDNITNEDSPDGAYHP